MAMLVKDANGNNQIVPLYIDPTYSAAETAITAVTSATDQLQLTGAAGIVARVKHVQHVITPTSTTGTSQVVQLVRRSTAASGAGATVNVTTSTALAKHNTALAAPSCVLSRFTGAAPTAGTAAGTFRSGYVTMNQSGTTAVGAAIPLIWDFSTRGDRAVEVVGTSDYVCVNWNTVTQIGTYSYEFEWEEGLV